MEITLLVIVIVLVAWVSYLHFCLKALVKALKPVENPIEKSVEDKPQYNASYGDPEIKMYLDQQFSRKGE